MNEWFGTMGRALAARQQRWRRARNLRLGQRGTLRALPWAAALGCLAVLGGAVVLAGHARYLGGAANAPAAYLPALDQLQPAAPGMAFEVGRKAGVHSLAGPDATLVIASGMQPAAPVRVNLCQQLHSGKLLPVRIGYELDELKKLPAVRNAVLAPQDTGIPHLDIAGHPARLTVAASVNGRWVSDTGGASLRHEGWLLWQGGAVRVQHRRHARCAAGELLVQSWRPAEREQEALALVAALPRAGRPVSTFLPPGSYSIPVDQRASLEDQALFQQLLAAGLLRLSPQGLAQVAPRDLASWQQAAPDTQLEAAAGWPGVTGDDARGQLFRRLYRMADGAYVREQVRIFNNERRLLAWRVRPALAHAPWQADAGGVPLATAAGLPPAAARLFAELPQGWGEWQRIAAWPGAAQAAEARISIGLTGQAAQLDILLAGRVLGISGGHLRHPPRAACTGRACRAADAVQALHVTPAPGARTVTLTVAPLDMTDSGERQYRHLHLAAGRLAWRTLPAGSATARAPQAAAVRLHDRHGTLLWSGGAATEPAVRAGLAPLLGLNPEHGSSIAGMLARVPASAGPHSARLSLDLALQRAAHDALDCIGLRRGQWMGGGCSHAQPVPAGRQAGLVVIDTASGDILAAAGAGTLAVGAANWDEVRDFDRANPDRSPLRLPALQHDGGAHRSPGSTFKIVSALGLELAARADPRIEPLLAGMPLAAINQMARDRGFDFQTAAASYPRDPRQARITNYRDQHLDRRAQDGRLGLAQALTYSLNTWFAWSGELSDASLLGRASGGWPGVRALEPGALDGVRPIVAMARRVGFEQVLRLDGGLLPADFRWQPWDALQPGQAAIDPVDTRHELRQMAIGLRMQATPLHMAMVAGAVGEGRSLAPRLLLELDGRAAGHAPAPALGVRLDRVRAGMKGVVEQGTAAAAFRAPQLAAIRRGLAGKTGTAPAMVRGPDGRLQELATVWFTGFLEPGSIPGERRRLALAVFISHSPASGGEHAAPVAASLLAAMGPLRLKE